MTQAWLSYEAAPPPWLPGSFFTAGIGWLLALGLMLLLGPDLSINRYDPFIITLTHMLALGVLGNCMLGALLQLLAVAAGVGTPRALSLWWRIYPAWQAGIASLCWGFAHGFMSFYLLAGASLLGMSGGMLLWHAARGLWHSPARDMTSQGMRLALLGLAVALSCGMLLTLTLSGKVAIPFLPLLHTHVLWAGLGYLLSLLLAVSQTVIPMFLISPAAPSWSARLLPAQLRLLVGISMALFFLPASVRYLAWAVVLPASIHAVLALRQLYASRRRQDPLLRSWLLALSCLWLAQCCGLLALAYPQAAVLPVLCGLLWLGGMGLASIVGMLAKIAPFLAWLHLQRLQAPRGMLPSTHGFLSEQSAARLAALHALWLLSALACCYWPACWQQPLGGLTLLLATLAAGHGVAIYRRYRSLRALCLQQRPVSN